MKSIAGIPISLDSVKHSEADFNVEAQRILLRDLCKVNAFGFSDENVLWDMLTTEQSDKLTLIARQVYVPGKFTIVDLLEMWARPINFSQTNIIVTDNVQQAYRVMRDLCKGDGSFHLRLPDGREEFVLQRATTYYDHSHLAFHD